MNWHEQTARFVDLIRGLLRLLIGRITSSGRWILSTANSNVSFCTRYVCYPFYFDCLLKNINFVGFVADHVGEKERVAERLEQEAVENPADGPQHFWQGGYNARTLATLKDRVWRGVILVERCRAILNRIHEVMFPSDPRVQGINALLDCFRGVGPI